MVWVDGDDRNLTISSRAGSRTGILGERTGSRFDIAAYVHALKALKTLVKKFKARQKEKNGGAKGHNQNIAVIQIRRQPKTVRPGLVVDADHSIQWSATRKLAFGKDEEIQKAGFLKNLFNVQFLMRIAVVAFVIVAMVVTVYFYKINKDIEHKLLEHIREQIARSKNLGSLHGNVTTGQ